MSSFPLIILSQDCEIDFAKVTNEDDRVAVVATRAITSNEEWIELKKGELLAFYRGRAYTLDDMRQAISEGVEFTL